MEPSNRSTKLAFMARLGVTVSRRDLMDKAILKALEESTLKPMYDSTKGTTALERNAMLARSGNIIIYFYIMSCVPLN